MGSYEVRRATTKEGLLADESIIGETDGLVFVDSSFSLDQQYYYAVTPVDAAGNRGSIGDAVFVRVPDQSVAFYSIQPKDNEIVLGDKVTLLGKTDPLSMVQVHINEHDYTVSADNDGDFSLMVALEEGKNDIVYTITDEYQNTFVKTIGVFMFTDEEEAKKASAITGAMIIDATPDEEEPSEPLAEQSKSGGFWILAVVVALTIAVFINRSDTSDPKDTQRKKVNHRSKDLGMNEYLNKRKSRK